MANESGIDSDLIRGHIDTIILKSLFESDKYGYEICKEVEERSGGTYELKQPTLYSCLKRLENQKLISSYWTDSEIGGKRHYYKLTDLGKETYQKNQDDWNRSRVIIDSLISNGEAPKFISDFQPTEDVDGLKNQIETLKKQLEEEKQNSANNQSEQEIDNLTKQIEELKVQLETEKQNKPEPEEKIVYVPVDKTAVNFDEEPSPASPIETDQTDGFIPWKPAEGSPETEDVAHSFSDEVEEHNALLGKEVLNEDEIASTAINNPEAELETSQTEPAIMQEGEQTVKYVQLSDNFIARVASNGEILSVEKAPLNTNQLEEELQFEEDNTPAQVSVFETSQEDLIFDESEISFENNKTASENEPDEEVDIMALLGHTTPTTIEHEEQLLLSKQEQPKLESTETSEFQESSSPFVFQVEDDFEKNETFLDSESKQADDFYNAPIEKIAGKDVSDNSATFDFDKFKAKHSETEEDQELLTSQTISTINNQEQFEEDEIYSPAPVYHNLGAVQNTEETKLQDEQEYNPDDIYENPDKKAEKENVYSLFDEEDLLENNDEEFEETMSWNEYKSDTSEDNNDKLEQNQVETKDSTMPFYQSTENYDLMETTFTEEKYKEKLNSLMTYQTNDGARQNYKMLTAPKDFKELKADFEEEGIVVKPHIKMVKESKSTRSYVESNKLNLVNSWTAYGLVAFITTLTFLIMNSNKSSFSTFDFSAKYFLIGLAILMIIPLIYSIIFFVNPYKKKPARYAHRFYLLFAFLLTIQLLIIIYSINLQLGFYSIHQENYNHLYWIVPAILSTYPLFDAILHGIYFNSRNFHI